MISARHGSTPQIEGPIKLGAELAANKVGGRRGKPAILVVRADEMIEHAFYRSENGVWLVEHVPSAFIEFPA